MLDIKLIREKPDLVAQNASNKGVFIDIKKIFSLDEKRRKLLTQIEQLRHQQKQEKNLKKARSFKTKIKNLENQLKPLEKELNELLLIIPNLAALDVKVGKDETENEILYQKGQLPHFDFSPQSFDELGEALDVIDTKRASKISGSRFGYLKNEGVLLEFALIRYGLDLLLKEGFIPLIPPVMIKKEMARGTGYFEAESKDDAYYLEKDEMFLVGTSEQSIIPYYAGEVLEAEKLPQRFVGFSTCFRREAGSYGKDTKGIFRVHQFDKLEMISFTLPEDSDQEHEYLLSLEEKLVQGLGLPYQVVKMCTGDLGLPAARKYDIECWLPSQSRYRETHSCSNCTDFQARRLNIKYKDKKGHLAFIHTLNGTALAVGRLILAILENYQQKDGSVKVPQVLQKYCGFKVIRKKKS